MPATATTGATTRRSSRPSGAQVVAATDFAKRDELLKDAQRIIARDAVNGFLFQLAKIGVWKKGLVGMWENSPTPQLDLTGVYWK